MRQRCTIHASRPDCESLTWLEEISGVRGNLISLGCELAQRSHLVHHPESSSVGCDIKIIAVHDNVAHRGHGHVVLERLPLAAVVERDVDPKPVSSLQQTFY